MGKSIVILGRLIPNSGKIHQGQELYDTGGVLCTLKATCYKDPPKIIQVGNIVKAKHFTDPQRGRIYSTSGLCPALNTVGGGGLEPKIIVTKRK